jgi:AcrR family transcriptional regulator
MPKVTEAHLEARRQQIVDAAWACFARKGYHQTTMQDICQESGLSPGAIYRYFASKEAILKAINHLSQEMGRALVEEARSLASGPLDTLQVIGQTMLSYFDDPMSETTTRVNIEIWPEIIRSDELRGNLRTEITFWRTVVSQLLGEAKAQGDLREEVDPESLAVVLISTWEGIRHYSLIDPDAFRPERFIDLMRALVSEKVPFDTGEVRRKLAAPRRPLAPPLRTPRSPQDKDGKDGD